METQKFTRKPITIEAVQVTPKNVEEVAAWCGGTVTTFSYRMMGGFHDMGAIVLSKQGPKRDRDRVVTIGNWITKHKKIFRAWTKDAFSKVYSPEGLGANFELDDLVKVGTDEDTQPWEGWEGKVVQPHFVGVDFGSRGRYLFEPSQIAKIDEMDSYQLELNAGIEAKVSGDDVVGAVLDQMREELKERIAAMEAENLSYVESEIRVGDLVKIKDVVESEPASGFNGQCGHVDEINGQTITVAFATADLDKVEKAAFHRSELEKLRQDGETLNQAEDVVTINQFREQLGMRPLGAVGDELMPAETVEGFKKMTEEQKARFVEVQIEAEQAIFNGGDLSFDADPGAIPTAEVEELAGQISREKDVSYLEGLHEVLRKKADKVGKVLNNPFKESDFVKVVGAQNAYHGYNGNVTMTAEKHCRVRLDMGPEVTINIEDLQLFADGRPEVKQDDMVEVNDPKSKFFGSVGRVTTVGVCEELEGHDIANCKDDKIEVIFESHGQTEYANFLPNWLKKI